MTIWCLASFFVFGIWQQKFGTYYTFIVEMIRAFLLSLSSIISSRFLFPRALAGSLASFDTSSIVNTEGVPLLEENEFETEGSGNSVRKKNPFKYVAFSFNVLLSQVSGDTASAYSESSTKSR